MKSTATLATAVALLSGAADAFWRMECRGRTGLARIDPLVEPGEVANHAHAIHGGSNFGLNTDYDSLIKSECTSCMVKQDKSAYWTPSLHFIHKDGKAEVVGQAGGMLVYYLLPGELDKATYNVTSFPKGLRILAGDTRQRNFSGSFPDKEKSLWGPDDTTQQALGQKALGFNCMNYDKDPEPTAYRHFLPDKNYLDGNCKDGIRAEIYFPSCWDGKNLDSTNHRDHVAYPNLVNAGKCPDTHPIQLPMLLFETIWEVGAYRGKAGQFVFANGDPTGFGYHGDFIMGWQDEDFLKKAVAQCTNKSGVIEDCPVFTQDGQKKTPGEDGGFLLTQEEMQKCKFEQVSALSSDNCEGPAEGLCGNVPIQAGPEYASLLKPGNKETPTAGYTPGPSATPAVPTLPYTTARSVVNGISVYNAAVPSPSSSKQAQVQEYQAPPPPTTPSAAAAPESPSPTPQAPAPTPAPPAPAVNEKKPEGSIISTKTITSAGVVYEVAIEEVAVYVTVEAPPAVKERRHVHHVHHRHHRRDREHGLLGRY